MFCGTCSVESKLADFFNVLVCNDKQEYLIAMLNGVQKGYELPENITENQYKYIREHKDEDKVLTGFVGFGCSFAGKFFGGYARNKTNTNYASQSKRSLLKDICNLSTTKFICMDYQEVELPEDTEVLIPNSDLYKNGYYVATEVDDYSFSDKVLIDTDYESGE